VTFFSCATNSLAALPVLERAKGFKSFSADPPDRVVKQAVSELYPRA
jgi:hypothetical protein